MPEREFFVVLESLLATGEWSAAHSYFRVGARDVKRRADGLKLRTLLDRVPPDVRAGTDWREVQVWVAYRAGDQALLREVISAHPGLYPGFEAYLGAWRRPWEEVLAGAQRALDGGVTGLERVVAGRFRAVALARLGRADWQEAFRDALGVPQSDRDRGLLCLEFGHQLVSAGLEMAARDVWAQAATYLSADAWALTQAFSNLGITCLRLDDLPAAERAFARAVKVAQGTEARGQLSIGWRGLGSLYLWSGQLGRAEHAYRTAEEKADDVPLTVMARRGLGRVLRARGHLDEALEVLRSALLHAGVRDGDRHAAFTDLAGVQVLIGDHAGAHASLDRVVMSDVVEAWRAQIVRAELARVQGDPTWAAHLQGIPAEHHLVREEARSFPDTMTAVGVVEATPEWWIDVNLDGPVRVVTATGPVQLRPTEASLLAFLTLHQGSVSVERALAALDLGGGDLRRQKRQLNRVIQGLRGALGWSGAVEHSPDLVTLSREPRWTVREPRDAARVDTFCEGSFDPWVTEYRSDMTMRSLPD